MSERDEIGRDLADLYRVIVENSLELVSLIDMDGKILYASPSNEPVSGYSPEEVVGTDAFSLIHPDDLPAVARAIQESAAEGTAFVSSVRVRHKDGHYLEFESSGRAIFDETGNPAMILVTSRDLSERERATDLLRRSEARKAAILEAALDCVITIDHEGHVLEFNPAAERTFGRRAEDALGRVMAELIIPPSIREQHYHSFARYLETGEAHVIGKRVELTGMRSDGSEFPVEIAITRIEGNGPPVFTAYLRDITERKRTEEALRLSASIIESTEDAVIGEMLDGTIVSWNPAAQRMYGYTAEEALRQSIYLIVPTDLPDDIPMIMGRLKRGESIEHYETVRVRKDGTPVDVSLTVSAIKDDDGEVVGASVIARDISAQKRLEQERADLLVRERVARENAEEAERSLAQAMDVTQETLALLDTLLATAPVGLAFIDRDLRYLRINETMAALNAASPEQHLGRTVREMLPELAEVMEPIHRQVLETGEPVLDHEVTVDVQGSSGMRGYWLANYYPVRRADGEVLGVGVVIVDITERKHTEHELRAARRELTDQLADATRLLQLSGRLSASLELQPVLDEVLGAVISLQGAASGVLRLYDTESGELHAVASAGLSNEYLDEVGRIPSSEGIWGRAFSERRPHITEDIETDPAFEGYREAARRDGFRSVYTSPLITRRDDIIGTISTHFQEPRRPSEREVRLIELYAYEAADVIDNARLYRDAQEARDRLEFLAEASRILSASLDFRETLQQVARLVVPRLADWCTVHILEEDGAIRQLAVTHVDPSKVKWALELQQRYPPDPDAPTGAPNVLRTGRSELYPEISADLLAQLDLDDEQIELVRSIGMRSAMIVPLVARGRTLGAISFIAAESGRTYGPADVAFAEDLARRAGQGMDNARLYTETRHIAQTLQNSLLPPQIPDIPGVQVAARYLPAGEGAEVGGDFYDLFETYDGAWGVVIGDVCGKGPEAAAVTGLARYTIRAAAMKEASPSLILGTLNEAIRTQRDDLRFATVAYARMSRDNGSMHVATACGGHPLPLVLRKDGRVEHLGQPGTLLGVFGDAELVDRSAVLFPGDAVIMYTDGITQDRGPLGPLTDETLASLVGTFSGMDAEAMADRILEAAMGEDPAGPRDDMAVLTLKMAS